MHEWSAGQEQGVARLTGGEFKQFSGHTGKGAVKLNGLGTSCATLEGQVSEHWDAAHGIDPGELGKGGGTHGSVSHACPCGLCFFGSMQGYGGALVGRGGITVEPKRFEGGVLGDYWYGSHDGVAMLSAVRRCADIKG